MGILMVVYLSTGLVVEVLIVEMFRLVLVEYGVQWIPGERLCRRVIWKVEKQENQRYSKHESWLVKECEGRTEG